MYMCTKFKDEWVHHLIFMLLDVLGFQMAYRLSYWVLLWFADAANEPFYATQALVFLFLQVAVCLVMQPYNNILRRGNDVEMLKVAKTTAAIMVLDIIYLFIVIDLEMLLL